MVIKIGFCGAQGTGKTTNMNIIAGELGRRGYNVGKVEEVARNCPLPINQSTKEESQVWILAEQLKEEINQTDVYKRDIVICDRTVIDIYAYYRYNHDKNDMFESVIEEWADTYDLIVYYPPNDAYLKDDGVRSVDKRYRDKIDNIMLDILDEYDYIEYNNTYGVIKNILDEKNDLHKLPSKSEYINRTMEKFK